MEAHPKVKIKIIITYRVINPEIAVRDWNNLQFDILNISHVSSRLAIEKSTANDLKLSKTHLITKIQDEILWKYKNLGLGIVKIDIVNLDIEDKKEVSFEEETEEEIDLQEKHSIKKTVYSKTSDIYAEKNFHDKEIFQAPEKFREKEYREFYCKYCKARLTKKMVFGRIKCDFCDKWNKIKNK